jgi:malate dehydrogenase (quinone)
LTSLEGVTIHFNHEVRKINKRDRWQMEIKSYRSPTNQKKKYTLVCFIELELVGSLLKTDIQRKGHSGFPVGWSMAKMH